MQVSSVASEGKYSIENNYWTSHPVQKFLMHHVSFCSISECLNLFFFFFFFFFESLNCPHCEKMDLKIIQSLLERKGKGNAGKLKNLQDMEDFSEEQCSV